MLPELNEAGFLKNREEWTSDLIYDLAETINVEVTPEVVELVFLARRLYEENGTVPVLREFSKLTGGDRKGTHLFTLFKGRPMAQISKLAGLPEPSGC